MLKQSKKGRKLIARRLSMKDMVIKESIDDEREESLKINKG